MDREFEGFEYVDEVYLEEPNWDFYILAIWKGDHGYYIGTDAGCSCPTPFENYTATDLTGPLTAEQVREEATSLWGGYDPEGFHEVMNALNEVE